MNALKLSALIGLAVVAAAAVGSWTKTKTAQIKVIHRGKLEKVEYATRQSSAPSVSTGSIGAVQVVKDVSVVHMQDGSQVVIDGKIDVLFAKGTPVAVEENGLRQRKLVADLPAVSAEWAEASGVS